MSSRSPTRGVVETPFADSDGERNPDTSKIHDKSNEDYDSQDEDERMTSDIGGDMIEYTVDEERAILKKLDRKLVFFMSFLYLLSFIDRSNIGNAKIAGLTEDLRLSDDRFEWLLTGFYITYIAFEWMILLYHYLTPHVYISICVVSWGVVASLQSVVTSFPQLLILRILLGVGEAAFSPGVPYYLSFFYRREELALRAGLQVSAAPLASSFAGTLAYIITQIGDKSPIASWRLLFLLEGFPSIVVGVIAWSFVPDHAGNAKFLTPRQQRIAAHRLRDENTEEEITAPKEHGFQRGRPGIVKHRVDWGEIYSTVCDPKCYLTALMFLSCNIAFSSMPVFLPSVVRDMGYSSINAQALSAPPFLLAFVVLLTIAAASDRYKARGYFVCLSASLSLVGYGMIALGGVFQWGNAVRYAFVYPAAAGFFSAITIIITWTMNNQQSNAKKGTGMMILNIVGQCGPLIGTRLYPDGDAPYYVKGMSVCALAMVVVIVLALVLRRVLKRENALLERQYGRIADGMELLARNSQGLKPRQRNRFTYIL